MINYDSYSLYTKDGIVINQDCCYEEIEEYINNPEYSVVCNANGVIL